MGLDSFWVDAEGKSASVEGKFEICGGMLSGHGNDSFRGKRYAGFIQESTGVSLYQESIPASVVKEMAEKLVNLTWANKQTLMCNQELYEQEINDLIKMFKLHADSGHEIRGWW